MPTEGRNFGLGGEDLSGFPPSPVPPEPGSGSSSILLVTWGVVSCTFSGTVGRLLPTQGIEVMYVLL